MSKVITSPLSRFPGTVTLADPLTLTQAIAWEAAWAAMMDINEEIIGADGKATSFRIAKGHTRSEEPQLMMPGFKAVVETWALENFDPDNPPGGSAMLNLTQWLINEVWKVYNGAGDDSPNG